MASQQQRMKIWDEVESRSQLSIERQRKIYTRAVIAVMQKASICSFSQVQEKTLAELALRELDAWTAFYSLVDSENKKEFDRFKKKAWKASDALEDYWDLINPSLKIRDQFNTFDNVAAETIDLAERQFIKNLVDNIADHSFMHPMNMVKLLQIAEARTYIDHLMD